VPTGTLRREDATAVGRALGRLHARALPPDEVATAAPLAYGRAHWCGLIERGERVGAPWTDGLRSVLPGVLAAEARAIEWAAVPRRRIGSHRDVRPDNALRVDGRLLLVDWDGAGPAVAGREVAGALRWWAPFEDDFLAGYTEGAGAPPDLDEGAGEDGGLVWWLEVNVRAALDLPGDSERAWAVGALALNFA
jgi:Ser/Thr protein kinase RdoA (MazF antagonist)